ncbi:hypothetical protein OG417_36960 [Actinoallomurus sp. NBC_01490]|jgi:hypothetical protein|uniref:hypothetical protein n=1 Tax=Actinoallomurus sp. NBC_01490 TaxID=2903557 RepID=UPI002E35F1D0|nr:hypothetical protein [Actinoallomurus sp. NBC_01490]
MCRRKPGDRERVIRVEFQVGKEPTDALTGFSSQERPSDLVSDPRDAQPKTVAGLGDEAVAYYSTNISLHGARVLLHAADAGDPHVVRDT